jgi:glycosyltransferase involved in cell wall biosynthesis
MRVMMLSEPAEGGVPEAVSRLAVGLRAHGVESEVAGPLESPFYGRLEAAGVTVHRLGLLPGLGRPRDDARLLRPILGLLRSRHPDLVHCHSAKAGVLGRLAARRVALPAVFSPHSWAFDVDYGGPRPLVTLGIERALGPLTAAVICVSEHERRLALRHRIAPARRLHVVHNGCAPCDEAVEPDPELEALRAAGPLAAAVTALRPQKSVEVLLDAEPELWRALPEARVAVVGNGPEGERLAARAGELGLLSDPRFRMLPFRGPAARHLRALDLYVLPSSYEGFPIGVLEAQACGVPQVATDVGGTAEAVTRETGVLVAPRDPSALAAAIATLLGDPGRRAAMAQASRVRQREHFGLEGMIEGTAAVYREVLRAARDPLVAAEEAVVAPTRPEPAP